MKHIYTAFALTALATVITAPTASAQTVRAQSATQRVRPISPASQALPNPQTQTAPVSRTSEVAVQSSPFAAASKQTIPGNLFSIEDRAIIIVGGKPVAAGDVKRALLQDVRQNAGPVFNARTNPRAYPAMAEMPVRDNPLGSIPGGLGVKLKPRFSNDRVSATGGTAGASVQGYARETAANKPAMSYAELMNYCKTHPMEISRVRGKITPNGRFSIEGICFGDTTGAVDVIGQFPGGHMRLVFESWSDIEIHAFVPPVTGAADHAVAVTVVRQDKARSPAYQANFYATREMVPVPQNYWSPSPDFLKIDIDQGGGNVFSGYTVFGTGPSPARVTPFSVRVNPSCALDTAGWSVRTGQVVAVTGWEDGPAYSANINVAWQPRCVIQTNNFVFASSSQRICDIDFALSAQASCPVGIPP